MVFKYDAYLVWSEQTRRELQVMSPHTARAPIHVVGAAQFDVFFQDRFRLSRSAFCATQGLRPDRPIILYAIGSPNLLRGERDGALDLAERLTRGELGEAQLLVRPHPMHDTGELVPFFAKFGRSVVVQGSGADDLEFRSQDESQTVEWVNSFRHADVVVNLSSTVAVDAALFDRPVVNLDYDPAPDRAQQLLVHDINHVWTHFKPIAESGGVWLVRDSAELLHAVKTYLSHPELHRAQRRWVAEYVCGYVDGRSGERTADAILTVIRTQAGARRVHGR